MTKTLSQIERDWFIARTGTVAPTGELKRKYWKLKGAVGYSLSELEVSWLHLEITAKGGTPLSDYPNDLWKQLNLMQGYKVSNYYNENRMSYYLNEMALNIVNPGFETGSGSISATGWIGAETYGWGAYRGGSPTFTASYDNTVYHGGTQSMKLDVTACTASQYVGIWPYPGGFTGQAAILNTYTMIVEPNTTYRVSFWYKLTGVSNINAGGFDVRVGRYWADYSNDITNVGNQVYILAGVVALGDTPVLQTGTIDWTYATRDILTTTEKYWANLVYLSYETGTVWVDDFTVIKL